eukprot:ctg_83.g29
MRRRAQPPERPTQSHVARRTFPAAPGLDVHTPFTVYEPHALPTAVTDPVVHGVHTAAPVHPGGDEHQQVEDVVRVEREVERTRKPPLGHPEGKHQSGNDVQDAGRGKWHKVVGELAAGGAVQVRLMHQGGGHQETLSDEEKRAGDDPARRVAAGHQHGGDDQCRGHGWTTAGTPWPPAASAAWRAGVPWPPPATAGWKRHGRCRERSGQPERGAARCAAGCAASG